MDDLSLEVFEISWAKTACHAGFQTEEAEDGFEGDVSSDELFDGVVLVGWVGACGVVLLDF